MGDISEMRGLLVVASVIIIMVAMVIIIPSSIIVSNITNSANAGVINPINVLDWNTTYTINLTYTDAQEISLNGFNYDIFTLELKGTPVIIISTFAEWGPFKWDSEGFDWYYSGNLVSDTQAINATTIDNYATPATFTLVNSKTSFNLATAYDTTSYGSFKEALENNDAFLVFQTDWNERDSSLNAFQLLGMIYTASLPGLDPLTNYLITIPLWIATIYLAFIFILRLTGALFGGGA
jgi:hypothetical protein